MNYNCSNFDFLKKYIAKNYLNGPKYDFELRFFSVNIFSCKGHHEEIENCYDGGSWGVQWGPPNLTV